MKWQKNTEKGHQNKVKKGTKNTQKKSKQIYSSKWDEEEKRKAEKSPAYHVSYLIDSFHLQSNNVSLLILFWFLSLDNGIRLQKGGGGKEGRHGDRMAVCVSIIRRVIRREFLGPLSTKQYCCPSFFVPMNVT